MADCARRVHMYVAWLLIKPARRATNPSPEKHPFKPMKLITLALCTFFAGVSGQTLRAGTDTAIATFDQDAHAAVTSTSYRCGGGFYPGAPCRCHTYGCVQTHCRECPSCTAGRISLTFVSFYLHCVRVSVYLLLIMVPHKLTQPYPYQYQEVVTNQESTIPPAPEGGATRLEPATPRCSGVGRCIQNRATNTFCDEGGPCEQKGSHNPSCMAGGCDQTGATNPTCEGGGCRHFSSVRGQVFSE